MKTYNSTFCLLCFFTHVLRLAQQRWATSSVDDLDISVPTQPLGGLKPFTLCITDRGTNIILVVFVLDVQGDGCPFMRAGE